MPGSSGTGGGGGFWGGFGFAARKSPLRPRIRVSPSSGTGGGGGLEGSGTGPKLSHVDVTLRATVVVTDVTECLGP